MLSRQIRIIQNTILLVPIFFVLTSGCDKRQKEIVPQNMTKKFLEKSAGTYKNQGQFKLEISPNRTVTLESYFFTPSPSSAINPYGIIPCKITSKANIQDVFKIPKNRGDQNYSRALNQYIPSDSPIDYIIKFTSDPVISTEINRAAVTNLEMISETNENLCKDTSKSQTHLFIKGSDKFLAIIGELGENIELIDNIYHQVFATPEEKSKNDLRFRKAGLRFFVKQRPDLNTKLDHIQIKDLIPDYQESHLTYEISSDPYDRFGNTTWIFDIDPSWKVLSIKSKSNDSIKNTEQEKCKFSFRSSIKMAVIPFDEKPLILFEQLQKQIFSLDHYFDGGTVYQLDIENKSFESEFKSEYEAGINKDYCKNSFQFFELAKNPNSIQIYFMLGQSPYANSLIMVDPLNQQNLGSFYLKKL